MKWKDINYKEIIFRRWLYKKGMRDSRRFLYSKEMSKYV